MLLAALASQGARAGIARRTSRFRDDRSQPRLSIIQALTHSLQHAQPDARMLLDETPEIGMTEHAQFGMHERFCCVIGSRAGEKRGFSDEVARPEDPDHLLVPSRTCASDLHLTGVHHHQLRQIRACCIGLLDSV